MGELKTDWQYSERARQQLKDSQGARKPAATAERTIDSVVCKLAAMLQLREASLVYRQVYRNSQGYTERLS